MEKNIVLPVKSTATPHVASALIALLKVPFEALRSYYGTVLEQDVTPRQALLLINAQFAFLFAAFPVAAPLWLRVVCGAWFLHAVLKCKAAF